jgi:protocatechuate 3,4-dioxygenase alpha subunit
VSSETSGKRYVIQGQLRDADGLPIPDGMIEIWQANAHGKYTHPLDNRDLPIEKSFTGFGRTPTDTDGRFRFSTIKPGCVPAANGSMQAPHILVAIFARGLIKQLVTRIYFPGDDHVADQVMLQVPVERRATLIAKAVEGQSGVLEWNIAIGGGIHETVFFEL